jgi:hypothetical protein
MLSFVTNAAQPHDLQRFGVIGVVSVRSAFDAATRAVLRALNLAALQGFSKLPSSANLFRFALFASVLAIVLLATFLAPFDAGFLNPRSLLVGVFLYVLFVALVNLVRVFLSVFALLGKNLRMFASVVRFVKCLACFRVLEWHGFRSVALSGGF